MDSQPIELPHNFISVMKEFTADLKTTFPEHAHMWWIYGEETSNEGWKDLYMYCLKIYPERFFDIICQNEDIFKTHENPNDNVNVDFIPRVDFKKLYCCEGVSTQTQQTIWKYLKIILFMVIENVKDKSEFGETMNLFEGIDESVLQDKMKDAMSGLGDFFKTLEGRAKQRENGDSDDEDEGIDAETAEKMKEQGEKMMNDMFQEFEKHMPNMPNGDNAAPNSDAEPGAMPSADDIHNHLKGLFGGKLGSLANELMEELTEDLQETLGVDPNELNDSANPADVLKKLMRRPDKLMHLVKKIQTKFQDKMNSGDLSQEDIMKEASEMFRKMKEMGGNSKQMNEMFQNLAKNMGGSMGKNMKVDTNRIDRMMRQQDTKDRLRAKLKKKQEEKFVLQQSGAPNEFVYRPADGEKPEKTMMTDEQIQKIAEEIGDVAPTATPAKKKAAKKKNKTKK